VLLRNHREFVPPQHFFERLTHALLRRRDCVKSAVKDDDDGDDATAEPAKKKTEAAKKQEASLVAREDDRLLRSTIEIFRKVNEHHPCCFAARFPCALPKTTDQESLKPWEENATNGEAHVRVGTRTWTPLDSDRRAGSIRDQVVDHADIDLTTGAFTRGARADWARFHAMVRAMRGDLEPMEALIAPHDGGSHGNNGDGKTTINTRTASRSARANARNAYADADFNLDKDKDKDKDADADLDDNAYDSDIEETPLGVSLLWTHAVDVLVQDANARIEVFESRVSERAEELAAIAASASVATPTAKKPETESTGRAPDDSPVPDSQPTPVAGDGDDGNSASDKNGTWAVDVLRNTLLFRYGLGLSQIQARCLMPLPDCLRSALLVTVPALVAVTNTSRVHCFTEAGDCLSIHHDIQYTRRLKTDPFLVQKQTRGEPRAVRLGPDAAFHRYVLGLPQIQTHCLPMQD
jgi:hypothetical protein